MYCNILSRHEVGKGWLAQALILEAETFAPDLCQACSLSHTAAEARDNYHESKESGLNLVS